MSFMVLHRHLRTLQQSWHCLGMSGATKTFLQAAEHMIGQRYRTEYIAIGRAVSVGNPEAQIAQLILTSVTLLCQDAKECQVIVLQESGLGSPSQCQTVQYRFKNRSHLTCGPSCSFRNNVVPAGHQWVRTSRHVEAASGSNQLTGTAVGTTKCDNITGP
jgi:hypothetical protein